ncbi:acyl-CoA dehydrogenase [Novibacillus thermophilus]|uniref:Acyl-CoA dehydrogenase n=1 Tax=Novibacillus thermophilus TaxID=1471761 RepID=A0A1U9KAW8_9BACL|nr:acyl-CoA dehydrogenase family protein [Novibacillus thermophilus]AQS57219.1 acyl-CoA dehydrogenase [Novibacillus thermophilus]
MNVRFSEVQEQLRQAIRQFARDKIAPRVREMDEKDRFPQDLVQDMGLNGLLGLPVDKKWGGAGERWTTYVMAIEEISRVSAGVGVILAVHTSVGTMPIVTFGTEEQKARFVPSLAKGEHLGAFALTEPESGSDVRSMRTTARRDGNDYVLNGMKAFVTNATCADTFVTFALAEKGITAFVVEKGSPGLSCGKQERKMGLGGTGTAPLIFDDVRVPEENRLGEEGEGFSVAIASLLGGRIVIGAQALGIAEAALELVVDYVTERRPYSRPLAAMPLVQSKLGEMVVQVEAARLLVYRAAQLKEEGKPCAKEVAMAKLAASDAAMRLATEAVQLLGHEGCTKEYAVERLFREAKVTQIYEGTNEIQRMVISKELLRG